MLNNKCVKIKIKTIVKAAHLAAVRDDVAPPSTSHKVKLNDPKTFYP